MPFLLQRIYEGRTLIENGILRLFASYFVLNDNSVICIESAPNEIWILYIAFILNEILNVLNAI